MADVTGIFKADFSSFFDAVEQSQVKLKGLEADSSKVEGNLSRMANAFSGQKIIQDATMMAEIFERAGGATAFTEKELQRMGATGAEAVEKLQALGKEIPEGIQKIADQSKQADTATAGWGDSILKVAAGYLSLQGLQKVWGFATEIMDDADALMDLSAQTKISTTDLQNLGVVVSDFGLDMDQMGKAIFGLSKRIASGDDSVNDALMQMGLSIEQVKNLDPVEMFLTIMDAAGKMNDQFKDTSMVTLFGDKIGQVMAGATTDIREAYDAQVALNNAIGPDAVKALADADRAMETTWTRFKAWAAINVFGPLAADINTVVDSGPKLGTWSTLVATYLDRVATSAGAPADRMRTLRENTDGLNPAMLENTMNVNNLTRGYDGLAPAIANTAGETKRLADEEKRLHEQRFNPAETLAGFEHATMVAGRYQEVINENIVKERERQTAENEAHAARMAAGEGWVKQMTEVGRVNKEAADYATELATNQTALDAENAKLIESYGTMETAHTDAGAAAEQGAAQTVAAYAGISQQIELTSDGVRGWLELMKYTAQSNALLSQNSLYTSGSTYENQSRIGTAFSPLPGFAGGIQNFAGGLAKVHGGEVLANLPPGTSVFPRGQGLGATVNNTFNLVDSESNLARRVAELIMRNVRAGAQIGTA